MTKSQAPRPLLLRPLPALISLPAWLAAAALTACGGGGGAQPSAGPGPSAQAQASGPDMQVLAVRDDSPEAALTPVTATASSSERGDLSAAAAIDHDDTTRWGSAFSDNEWLTLDYGRSVAIQRVRIVWERAHASQYELQVSDDGSHWTSLKAVSGSQGGIEDWTGLSGQGRYLRMLGLRRAGQYGYSIYEIQAFAGTPAAPAPSPDPAPSPSPAPAPGPAPAPAPAPGTDLGQPGRPVVPVAATSSAVENGGLSAAMAVDGKAGTRWSSRAEDGAWIQFDFGAPTALGYLKLSWENAYGKEYALQTSNDGKTWTQLRYQSNGRGGTEEYFNLGANARYLRLQGVARATAYGYSLFEAEFKTPGSDNSIVPVAASALPFPANGSGLAPLPTTKEALETLQFSLPDGTLVTRFGVRGFARHGRERGEEWNEPGYGPNETVDANGLPLDKGPGNFLTFVAQYFQNRTWGFEIIDNSRVAGVTRPTLVVNQYNPVDFLPGGVAFFRAFDRPGVTGYGWMSPGELADPKIGLCPTMAYPPNGRLASSTGVNNGCTLRIKEYPGHQQLGTDGMPNGRSVAARPLALGDLIEVSPSFFSTREAMLAKGDTGGIRYYANEWLYVVGTGLVPWYGVQPRLYGVPLPAHTLSGGTGSLSYDYADNGAWIFQQPVNNVGMQNMQRFVEGRRLFHTSFGSGEHNEPGNDRYLPAVGLQGPRFNQSSCFACHVNNGRSPAPTAVHQRLDSLSVRTASVDAQGRQQPHPSYGMAIQMNAVSAQGTPQDWGQAVRVAGFDTRRVALADGSSVELRKPRLAFDGPTPAAYSLRMAQPVLGTGLLEAIPEADILARVRSTADEDGVLGTPNYVFDPETGAVRLGRFGWKASKASLRHQTAAALLQDMAVTSSLYPSLDCLWGPVQCRSGKTRTGIGEADLKQLERYLALLAVPAQRSLASGFPKGVAPLPDLDVQPAKVQAGAALFQSLRCTACHASEMKTGPGHLLAELRNQTIRPFTDLLLHDMGAELADNYDEGQAKGRMWRTAPLWGIGYTERVASHSSRVGYLHDGRARNLNEAILWHGGEAERSRQRYQQLSAAERELLLAFLRSL